jgi:DNA topoisomerase IA
LPFPKPQTKKTISSQSAIFLHKNYAEYYSLTQEAISYIPEDSTNLDDDLTDEELPEVEPFQNFVEDLPEEQAENPDKKDIEEVGHSANISTKGLRELNNLRTYYSPN